MEIFKTIPNYSLYQASNKGNIKTNNWKNTKKTAILKPALDKNGYLRTVLIRDDGKYTTIKVHRIISSAFLGDITGMEVNHKDGNKSNNDISNLELVTHSENIKHSFANNLQSNIGEKNPISKLNEVKVLEIRSKFKKHVYTREMLSKEYNVTISCIKDVLIRRSWAHL
jgi:hypothetical protein